MRSNVDNALMRGQIQTSAMLFLGEVLAISANLPIASGGPMIIALDPANTNRNVSLYTPTTPSFWHKHEIWNLSSGTGVLTIQQADALTSVITVAPGQQADVYWNPKTQNWVGFNQTNGLTNTVGSQQTIQQYTTLAGIVAAQVMAIAVPFAFKLNSVGFRTRTPGAGAGAAATLQAQVNGVSTTGGAIGLTLANQATSGGFVAGTSITGLNTGAPGNTIGVLASAVTAFTGGDGYVEYNVTNLSENV